MDLKKLLMAAAESQADKVKDDMISHLASDEMAEKIATHEVREENSVSAV